MTTLQEIQIFVEHGYFDDDDTIMSIRITVSGLRQVQLEPLTEAMIMGVRAHLVNEEIGCGGDKAKLS
jgi:hypothetical protein